MLTSRRALVVPALAVRALAAATLLLAAGAAHAQVRTQTPARLPAKTKPAPPVANFSGTWELNRAKSNFGPVAAPTKATMVITQGAKSIRVVQSVESPAGPRRITQEYSLDGRERPITGMDGGPAMSSGKIDGNMLTVDIKATRQGSETRQTTRFMLSPDATRMTAQQLISLPVGWVNVLMVFDKQ